MDESIIIDNLTDNIEEEAEEIKPLTTEQENKYCDLLRLLANIHNDIRNIINSKRIAETNRADMADLVLEKKIDLDEFVDAMIQFEY